MMNKLTAKKCLERIDKLKTSQRRFGISIFEEEYLEALEIALPILEQQEKGDDSAELINGWVEWDGGECPVIPGNRVDLKLRGGFITQDFPAEAGEWNHYGGVWDIIAYRVVEQERERGEEV